MASQNTGSGAANGAAQAAGAATTALQAAQEAGGTLLKFVNGLRIPLEIAGGYALSFAAALTIGIGKSETLRRGLEKVARIQYYTPQFAKLLGSLDLAKRRLAEIEKFASRGVFDFDDAAEGSKALQTLTRGVLATKQGMQMVGDAAAVSGAKFSDMANIVGNLQADISNERPIEGAIGQLVAMGAVSAAAGDKLRLLQANGTPVTEMLKAMQAALALNAGGMAAAAKTINGLEKALAAAGDANDKAFAEPFDEGKRAGLEAALKLTEALKPAFEDAGKVLSVFYNGIMWVAKGFAEWISAVPIVGAVLTGLVDGFFALIAATALFALQSTAQLLMALLKQVLGLAATATGWAVLRTAVLATVGAINAAIGQLGWLFLGISAVVGALSAFSSGSDEAAKLQEQMRNQVESTTDAIRKQIAAIQSQAEKSDAMVKAANALAESDEKVKRLKKRNEDRGSGLGLNTVGWWQNKLGGDNELTNAQTEKAKSQKDLMAASASQTDPALAERFGADYKAVAEESAKKMAEMHAEFVKTSNAGGDVKPILGKMQVESARDLKSEADRRFNRRMVMGDSRISAMREVGHRTGDRGMLDQADALEGKNFRAKREKELKDTTTLKGEDLKRVLERDTLVNDIQMQQKRGGTPEQSSLAKIGGASGFAGVINDIPKKQLELLKRLSGGVDEIIGRVGKEDTDAKFQNQ